MPELDKRYFLGEREIPGAQLRTLTTKGHGEQIDATLRQLGWEDSLVACVILFLSADNSTVSNSQFALRGTLSKDPINMQASKVWEKADEAVTMSICIPQGKDFSFESGTLCSEYIDQEAIKLAFEKDGQPILPTNWESLGIGNCSIRLIAHLDKTSNTRGPNIRYTVLIFPACTEELTGISEHTQSVAWPGIKILEGQCGFFPKSPESFWGTPIFPIIKVSGEAPDAASTPGCQALRFAIAELLKTAAKPAACTSASALRKRWSKVEKDGLDSPTTPDITWPTCARPAPTVGKFRNLEK